MNGDGDLSYISSILKYSHNSRSGDVYGNSIVFGRQGSSKEEFKVIFCLDELQILVNDKEAYNNFLLSVEPPRTQNKEASEEFKHVLLAFIYDKDDKSSLVAHEYTQRVLHPSRFLITCIRSYREITP